MKKLLIGFTILLGVSVVGASASFGYVLKNEINTYQINEQHLLQKESLKKVYIDSDIPIRVCMTQGQPRVEVKNNGIGVFASKPTYNVDLREEGDTTYINVDRDLTGFLGIPGIFVGKEHEEVVIYLAQQEMEQLTVRDRLHSYYDGATLQMDEVTIKNVVVDTRFGDVELGGDFETIELNQSGGSIKIDSKSPVKFVMDGQASVDLRGEFESIALYNHSGGVRVNSVVPTHVEIRGNSYYGQGQEIMLKGTYKNIDLNVGGGDVVLDLTTAPERINVLGEAGNVQIGLPKDIKGYTVVKRNLYETYEESDYKVSRRQINSEFSGSESQLKERDEVMVYGDQSTKVLVEGYESEILILQSR